MKNLKEKAEAYALKNAIAYDGKANPGAVISSLFHEGLKKEEVKKYSKEIQEIVKSVNKLSLEDQKNKFENTKENVSERDQREGLPELPDTNKGIVMRLAPAPSGPFHIGNALTFCLSAIYTEKYKGKLYIRIEDTNPENIYLPIYKLIEEDSKWLFKGLGEIIIQSDRMKLYYKYAEKFINKKAAYVCECSGDEFREYSKQKKNCPYRKKSLEQNKKDWKKMLDKKGFSEGQAVLRFKTSEGMKDPNPAMRDFPLARINLAKHPRVGNKYRVWPLMNLAVTTDDIEMKMTHIIRGKDHRDNAERQKRMYKVLGKKYPWAFFGGRIKFKDLILSKTQIRKDIEAGKYSGWDDPQLPTIASLRKRKYTPDAFWKLSEHVGLSENDKVIEKKEYFYLLDIFNKK